MTGVEILDVTKKFQKEATEVVALRETSLTIDAGSFVCLMGPSGSGKSTLLNLIAGIDRPSSGQVMVDGRDIAKLAEGPLASWRNHTTALGLVGLGDRMTHYPRQLSGGQEQRVAIARAIVTDPALILADEPTGDLDAQSADEVLAILEKLNKEFKKTVVMVTHDPRAARHANVVRHLDKGVLLPEGATA